MLQRVRNQNFLLYMHRMFLVVNLSFSIAASMVSDDSLLSFFPSFEFSELTFKFITGKVPFSLSDTVEYGFFKCSSDCF